MTVHGSASQRAIGRAWADLKRGKDVDVYLGIAGALVVGILGLAGIVSIRVVASVLLLCMAAVLLLVLAIRHRVDDPLSAGGIEAVQDWPRAEFERAMAATDDLLAVGVSLVRTRVTYYSDLERRVRAGRHVRVLLVSPEGDGARLAEERGYGERSEAGARHEIVKSLAVLQALRKEGASGHMEIKTIDFPIGMGGFAFDADQGRGEVYVEYYPYRMRIEQHVCFRVTPENRRWHDRMADELEVLWSQGMELPPSESQTL